MLQAWISRELTARIRPGDLVGCSSTNLSGVVINLSTFGLPFYGLSHTAIATELVDSHKLVLFESTSLCNDPDVISGTKIVGVQAHDITERIFRYDGKVWHYPLIRQLDQDQISTLAKACMSCHGWSYDMLGAFRSRDILFGWLERLLTDENKHSLFCSEAVASWWKQIGLWNPPDLQIWNPNRLARIAYQIGLVAKPVRLK